MPVYLSYTSCVFESKIVIIPTIQLYNTYQCRTKLWKLSPSGHIIHLCIFHTRGKYQQIIVIIYVLIFIRVNIFAYQYLHYESQILIDDGEVVSEPILKFAVIYSH